MRKLRALLVYVFLFFSTVYCGVSAIVVYSLTRRNEWPHLIGRLWGKLNLWAAGAKVNVKGLEKLDSAQPYIFAANHQSWFDIFAIFASLPVQFRWLAKEELFRVPVLGPAMTACGSIPIDRGDRKKAFESLNHAAAKVRSGTSIVIFPEGTRSIDGVLQDFKAGGFVLAIKSQQPIMPISISGSYEILPKRGDWKIRPGTILMTIGNPVPTVGITTRNRDALMSVVREAIREHLPQSEGGVLAGPLDDHSSTTEPGEDTTHAG